MPEEIIPVKKNQNVLFYFLLIHLFLMAIAIGCINIYCICIIIIIIYIYCMNTYINSILIDLYYLHTIYMLRNMACNKLVFLD